jgi:hypothetical protein
MFVNYALTTKNSSGPSDVIFVAGSQIVIQRVKSRARVTLNDGREAGLMLPRGLLLRGGDMLATEDGSEVIEVIAAAEQRSRREGQSGRKSPRR